LKTIPSAVLSAWLLFGTLSAEELPRAAPKDVGLSDEKLDHVKTLVQAAVDKNQTAGVAVLVARRGKVALLESFGRFSAKADRSMSSDAIFRIHSMTKPITTTAALVLYDEGRFKLDESVAKYLPELQGLRVYAVTARPVHAAVGRTSGQARTAKMSDPVSSLLLVSWGSRNVS
jgi:CubicO group peptidase (beta-lactamase class C family)